MRKIKIPIPGRLYKIISKVNFINSFKPKIKNIYMNVGHVILVSYKPVDAGYPTIRWEYILPNGKIGYHHNSEIDSFWEYFKET